MNSDLFFFSVFSVLGARPACPEPLGDSVGVLSVISVLNPRVRFAPAAEFPPREILVTVLWYSYSPRNSGLRPR